MKGPNKVRGPYFPKKDSRLLYRNTQFLLFRKPSKKLGLKKSRLSIEKRFFIYL